MWATVDLPSTQSSLHVAEANVYVNFVPSRSLISGSW